MNNRGLLDLIISLLPGLQAADKIGMINAFNSEEELYTLSKRQVEEIIGRGLKEFWEINDIRDKADRIETMCRTRSIKIVSWTSAEYPPLLREIYDPPSVLYYKGCLADADKSLLGMVGTRRPSPDAASQAYKLAFGAGQGGISVISGLAIGIDAMSHRGNLVSRAPGYAVLGSGIDEVYPSCNRPLAKRILDSGGALISEYHPGVRPSKWSFPARNRIISALSRGVLIVEAPEKSGALITAAFALEQGKDLWVASSGARLDSSAVDRSGTWKLAEDGAEIIHSARDIFAKWNTEMANNSKNVLASGWETEGKRLASSMADFLEIKI